VQGRQVGGLGDQGFPRLEPGFQALELGHYLFGFGRIVPEFRIRGARLEFVYLLLVCNGVKDASRYR
jgi:hypothetical protein